jgi:hypothetical protein
MACSTTALVFWAGSEPGAVDAQACRARSALRSLSEAPQSRPSRRPSPPGRESSSGSEVAASRECEPSLFEVRQLQILKMRPLFRQRVLGIVFYDEGEECPIRSRDRTFRMNVLRCCGGGRPHDDDSAAGRRFLHKLLPPIARHEMTIPPDVEAFLIKPFTEPRGIGHVVLAVEMRIRDENVVRVRNIVIVQHELSESDEMQSLNVY